MTTIYKITNKLNGKPYIGQTCQPLEKRFFQHSKADSPLGSDMRECGIENFTIEAVAECESVEQANQYEQLCIKVLGCKVPKGYNRTDGGEVGYSVDLTSSRAEKSALDLFVEENNLNESDRKFIETFAQLSPDTRAIIEEIKAAFAVRDAWQKAIQTLPKPTGQVPAQ